MKNLFSLSALALSFLAVLICKTSLANLGANPGAASAANPGSTLTFIVKAPVNTPAGSSLYVTGDAPELCSWRPDCLPLKPIGNDIFQASVFLPGPPRTIAYKATRGNWDTEAVDPDGAPYPNQSYFVHDPEHTAVFNAVGWKDIPTPSPNPRLKVFPGFHSPQLSNDRTIRVLPPAGYDPASSRSYPVIYMHDGQNIFDPSTSTSHVGWNVDQTLDSLTTAGSTREAIIVGIDCIPANRLNEYDYTLQGEAYSRFVIETVKPWVDSHFRTLPGRENTFTMGSSMGGHISLALLWRHPEVFSKAAALSLPAWIHNNSIYQVVDPSPLPTVPISFYMDYGDFAGDAGYPGPGADFIAHLEKLGLPDSELTHLIFPYADHFEADWARRVNVPLQWLLGPSSSPDQ